MVTVCRGSEDQVSWACGQLHLLPVETIAVAWGCSLAVFAVYCVTACSYCAVDVCLYVWCHVTITLQVFLEIGWESSLRRG